MIRSRIKDIAEARGIPNAYQLGLTIGVTPNVSARLWNDTFVQIGKVTLDKLCNAFGCAVGDLLVFEPSRKSKIAVKGKDKKAQELSAL
jgi:DNA-binding Xre family transcriptional regulator